MSQPASTHPSTTTGHGGWHPTVTLSGSSNVFFEGKPALMQGVVCAPHTKRKSPTHPAPTILGGSGTVKINGLAATRIGDAVDCGDTIAEGISSVFIGG